MNTKLLKFKEAHPITPRSVKRLIMAIVGVALSGVCVGIFNTAALGADPFTVFVTGLGNAFNLTYGTMYLFVTGILLCAVFFIDRRYINIATLFNLVGIGYIAEFTMNMLKIIYVPEALYAKLLMLVFAIVLLCFATSLYFIADLGVSAYDAMALILAKKTPIPFRACRIGTDIVCVAIGFFFHAIIGIGTVITAFFMGPIVQLFNTHFSIPFLFGKQEKKPK